MIKTKVLQFQNFGGKTSGGCGRVRYRCAVRRGNVGGTAGQVAADAGRTADEWGSGAGAVPCCLHRTKSKAADGSLVRYLCLIVYTLSSSVFSGLGDFWGEKSSSGVWGEAPYIMVLGRGMGRSPIKTVPHVGVRGAQPRYAVLPAGRGAPPIPFPCGARIIYQAF